jgi:lipopolysaccharide export system permease protein
MILTRYLYREILIAMFGLVAVLLLIFLSHRFVRYLAEASLGNLPSEFIFKLIGLKFLVVLGVVLPLAFFLAILLSFGRLYVDNEMTAIAASGVGTGFFLQRALLLALVIALPVGAVNLWLAPWAMQKQKSLEAEAARLADITGIAAGRFKEFNHGRGVFYIEDQTPDKQAMRNVFVAVDSEGKKVLVSASKAYQRFDDNGDRILVLEHGQRYEGQPGEAELTLIQFAEHTVRLRLSADNSPRVHLKSLDTPTLWHSPDLAHQAELQLRLSAPLALLLLAPLAVLMSHTTPRQGRYTKVLLAILLYFVYGNLLEVAQKWVERGNVPVWIGVWWVHGLVLVLLAGLLFQRLRRR